MANAGLDESRVKNFFLYDFGRVQRSMKAFLGIILGIMVFITVVYSLPSLTATILEDNSRYLMMIGIFLIGVSLGFIKYSYRVLYYCLEALKIGRKSFISMARLLPRETAKKKEKDVISVEENFDEFEDILKTLENIIEGEEY